MKGVADSGFIWIMGAIRTTPAKSCGLSHTVRIEMAPPWRKTNTLIRVLEKKRG